MVFPELHWILVFLLGPCFYSYITNKYHILLYISLPSLSLLATNSFLYHDRSVLLLFSVLSLGCIFILLL